MADNSSLSTNISQTTEHFPTSDVTITTNTSRQPGDGAGLAEEAADDYDSYGAMQFIVATVTVYAAMGVFCILVNNIRKKSSKQNQESQDDAVLKYLKEGTDLRLKGFHMQLKSLRSKYTEMVQRYEEKMRLLEIQKELETMDSSPPPAKRSRHTRRLSLFNIHGGKKDKERDKLHGKKRLSMDHSIGRKELSLLYMKHMETNLRDVEEVEEERGMDSGSDIDKLGIIGGEIGALDVDTGKKNANLSSSCVVKIEQYGSTGFGEVEYGDTLMPPVESKLSESV